MSPEKKQQIYDYQQSKNSTQVLGVVRKFSVKNLSCYQSKESSLNVTKQQATGSDLDHIVDIKKTPKISFSSMSVSRQTSERGLRNSRFGTHKNLLQIVTPSQQSSISRRSQLLEPELLTNIETSSVNSNSLSHASQVKPQMLNPIHEIGIPFDFDFKKDKIYKAAVR